MCNINIGITYYTYWRHLICCNFDPGNAMWHGWWHGKMAPNGKIVTCVWTTTKSCISFFVYDNHFFVLIWYFQWLFVSRVTTNLFNKQLQCSSSTFFFFSFRNWISPSEITYYEQMFMLTRLLNHNLMQTMWFWVLFHLSTHHCFWLSYMFHGFRAGLIIWQFKKCFNALFLNSCGT
jgi:hypothetical protein